MQQLLEFVGHHPVLVLSFVALLVLLVVNEIGERAGGGNNLTALDATQLANHQNGVFLDVREDKEYQEGHVLNAIHIPLGQLNDQVKKLEKYRHKPIIAYCRTGSRSASACARLRKQGFESVYNLTGGIMAWQKDNLPVTRK